MAVRVHKEALCNITVALWMLCLFLLLVIENVYSCTTSYIVYAFVTAGLLEAFEIHLQYVAEGC
jgi:hypothetical protein